MQKVVSFLWHHSKPVLRPGPLCVGVLVAVPLSLSL